MNHLQFLLILCLVVAVPAFGQQAGGSSSLNAQSGAGESAEDLVNAQKYIAEQHQFEKLLQGNKSAENYAGLAEALAMQYKIHEAEVVLRNLVRG